MDKYCHSLATPTLRLFTFKGQFTLICFREMKLVVSSDMEIQKNDVRENGRIMVKITVCDTRFNNCCCIGVSVPKIVIFRNRHWWHCHRIFKRDNYAMMCNVYNICFNLCRLRICAHVTTVYYTRWQRHY